MAGKGDRHEEAKVAALFMFLAVLIAYAKAGSLANLIESIKHGEKTWGFAFKTNGGPEFGLDHNGITAKLGPFAAEASSGGVTPGIEPLLPGPKRDGSFHLGTDFPIFRTPEFVIALTTDVKLWDRPTAMVNLDPVTGRPGYFARQQPDLEYWIRPTTSGKYDDILRQMNSPLLRPVPAGILNLGAPSSVSPAEQIRSFERIRHRISDPLGNPSLLSEPMDFDLLNPLGVKRPTPRSLTHQPCAFGDRYGLDSPRSDVRYSDGVRPE